MLIDPWTLTDVIGMPMLAIGLLYQWRKSKTVKEKKTIY
jgi:hypothetical protein